MKRAIIYCRVSTDEQIENTSLDGQAQENQDYAQHIGAQVVATFREDYTGTSLDRPELDKARAMLRAGQAKVLIVHRADRLDRSEWGINLLLLLKEFKELGVELHYSQQKRHIDLNNPLEALMQSIAGWQAGEDRNGIVKRLTEGCRNRAKEGQVVPVGDAASYGYQKVKRGNRWAFEINTTEAETVKFVFQLYVEKLLSCQAIARKLTKSGIPTRKGKPWNRSVVAKILDNETYAGKWYFGKGQSNFRNPRETWICMDVEPPINGRHFSWT